MAVEADRHLLFGLIALQVGLIDQAQLVAAFQAWARDKSRSLTDHLADRGTLSAEGRSAVESMVALHIKQTEPVAEKNRAAIAAPSTNNERPREPDEPELTGSVTRVVTGSNNPDAEGTVSYGDRNAGSAVPTVTGDGHRFKVLRPHAQGAWGPSLSRSMASCTARSP